MNAAEQKNNSNMPAISPLANERTYGERVHHAIFDTGLNYWVNLLSSAAFSHWSEHSTIPIKLPGMKEAASPRQLQQDFAKFLETKDPLIKNLYEKKIAEVGEAAAAGIRVERSMARARSLTLLLPGFFVMIPSVWLGAKLKPAVVEYFNRGHYGDEAMDDPSLAARHEAIRAEAKPTFFGAIMARMGTVLTAQIAAQTVGSRSNIINKIEGVEVLKKFPGVDPVTEALGEKVGGMSPATTQSNMNKFARKIGFDWSEAQIKAGKVGEYTNAAQDLGRFIAADTFYTLVSASTVKPALAVLKHLPFMTYKDKTPKHSATFEDGEKIKVPRNRYLDSAPEVAVQDDNINDTKNTTEPAAMDFAVPRAQLANVHTHERMLPTAERQHATP